MFESKPEFSEYICGGYVMIKIGEEWKFKHIYLYEKYYNDTVKENEKVIFLDRNNRNFEKDNLFKVTKAESVIFNRWYNSAKTSDDVLTAYLTIRLKQKRIEMAKANGLTNKAGRIIEDARESNRKYESKPEVKRRAAELMRERRRRIKTEDPERYEEMLRRNRERRAKNRDAENARARERRRRKKLNAS